MSSPKKRKPVDPGVLSGLSRTRSERRSARRPARADAPGRDATTAAGPDLEIAHESSPERSASPIAAAVDGARPASQVAQAPALKPRSTEPPAPGAGKAKTKAKAVSADEPASRAGAAKAKGTKGKAAKKAAAVTKAARKAAKPSKGAGVPAVPRPAKGAGVPAVPRPAKDAGRPAADEADPGAVLPAAAATRTVSRVAPAGRTEGAAGEAASVSAPAARRLEADAPKAREPAGPGLPDAGYASHGTSHPLSGTPLVGTALEAAGEVTRLGGAVARGLLSRLPRP